MAKLFKTTNQVLEMAFGVAEFCLANDIPKPYPGKEGMQLMRSFYSTLNDQVAKYQEDRQELVMILQKEQQKQSAIPKDIQGVPVIRIDPPKIKEATANIHEIDKKEIEIVLEDDLFELIKVSHAGLWDSKDGRNTFLHDYPYKNAIPLNIKIFLRLIDDIEKATEYVEPDKAIIPEEEKPAQEEKKEEPIQAEQQAATDQAATQGQ